MLPETVWKVDSFLEHLPVFFSPQCASNEWLSCLSGRMTLSSPLLGYFSIPSTGFRGIWRKNPNFRRSCFALRRRYFLFSIFSRAFWRRCYSCRLPSLWFRLRFWDHKPSSPGPHRSIEARSSYWRGVGNRRVEANFHRGDVRGRLLAIGRDWWLDCS